MGVLNSQDCALFRNTASSILTHTRYQSPVLCVWLLTTSLLTLMMLLSFPPSLGAIPAHGLKVPSAHFPPVPILEAEGKQILSLGVLCVTSSPRSLQISLPWSCQPSPQCLHCYCCQFYGYCKHYKCILPHTPDLQDC